MQLTEVTFEGQLPVDAYGPGYFRIDDQVHEGALLLHVDGVQSWAGFDDLSLIEAAAGSFDILFVGTGAEIGPLPAKVKAQFAEKNIAAEVMATPSACRTYNILLSEGRRVALAALPV